MTVLSGIRSGIRSGFYGDINPIPGRRFPASALAWSAAFPSITVPTAIWTFQETASPILDKIGSSNLVENNPLLYAQAGDTEPTASPRASLELDTTGGGEWTGPSSTTFGNIGVSQSLSIYLRFRIPDSAATVRPLAGKGAGAVTRYAIQVQATTGVIRAQVSNGTNTTNIDSSTGYDDGNYHDLLYVIDSVADVARLFVDSETVTAVALDAGIVTTIDTTGLAPAQGLRVGATNSGIPLLGTRYSYMALWSNVVLTAANFTTIRTSN